MAGGYDAAGNYIGLPPGTWVGAPQWNQPSRQPALAVGSGSGLGGTGLDDLFNFPEPQLDFGPVRDALTKLSNDSSSIAQDYLSWSKQLASSNDATIKGLVAKLGGLSDAAAGRAADYYGTWKNTFLPVQQQLAKEAQTYGGDADQALAASKAGADVNQSFADTEAAARRLDPNYGTSDQAKTQLALGKASALAGAETLARQNARDKGIALRGSVAQMGNVLPGAASQDSSLAAGALSNAGNLTDASAQTQSNLLNAPLGWQSLATNTASKLADTSMDIYKTGLAGRVNAAQGLGFLYGRNGQQANLPALSSLH